MENSELTFIVYCRGILKEFHYRKNDLTLLLLSKCDETFGISVFEQRFINFNHEDLLCENEFCNVFSKDVYILMLYSVGDTSSLDYQKFLAEYSARLYQDEVQKYVAVEKIPYIFINNLSLAESILPPNGCFRKGDVLVLHFYKSHSLLSKLFLQWLNTNFVKNSINVFGWDISTLSCSTGINHTLRLFNLDVDEISTTEGIVFLTKNDVEFILVTYLKGEHVISIKDIEDRMVFTANFAQSLNSPEDDSMNVYKYQEIMCNQFENEVFVCYNGYEHEQLKETLLYAIYGPPQLVPETVTNILSCYKPSQIKFMEKAYKKVVLLSNLHSKTEDEIYMRIVYNCTIQTDSVNIENFIPFPVICIRKCIKEDMCKNEKLPCEMIIDHHLRVYSSWQLYLENNKLNECIMIYPVNGRYTKEKGQVLLNKMCAPSTSAAKKALMVADVGTSLASIASGGVMAVGAMTSIAVAPVALVCAAAVGIGSGVYAIVRSSVDIHDKILHKEDLSFSNSEARAAYLNIGAGVLSFVSLGATTAVSRLAAAGTHIPEIGRTIVTTTNVLNIAASGASLTNTTAQVVMNAIETKEAPSTLTIIQLSSSLLFFGHSIYSFKTATTIINEAQMQAYNDIASNLKSNNQRKMLNKLLKETIRTNSGDANRGFSEVISAIRKVESPEGLMATLKSSNKLFNENKVRFSASSGKILLNGSPIDLVQFNELPKSAKADYLANLPEIDTSTSFTRTSSTNTTTYICPSYVIDGITVINLGLKLYNAISTKEEVDKLLHNFSSYVRDKLIQVTVKIIDYLVTENISFFKTLEELKDSIHPFLTVLRALISFASQKITEYPQFKYLNPCIQVLEKIIMFLDFGAPYIITEFYTYLNTYLVRLIYDFLNYQEQEKQRKVKNSIKVVCGECGGYSYK